MSNTPMEPTAATAAETSMAPAPAAPAPKATRRAPTRQRAAKAAPAASVEVPITPAAKAVVEAAASKARTTPKVASKSPRAAAAKGAAKAAEKAPAKAFPQSAATKAEPKPAEAKRDKLVRDSFTMPKGEYAAIAELKQRSLGLAHPVKKSELLRAGLMLLRALDDQALLAGLRQVPAIKTGRPARGDGKGAARKDKTGAH